MNRILIAGNWKMNKDAKETIDFAKKIKKYSFNEDDEVCLIPPFTDLKILKDELDGTNIKIGAQNCHFEDNGAYTGEISSEMLKEIGVEFCIVGHSERREYFGETDKSCNKKIIKLLEKEITPILCVGEKEDIREVGAEQSLISKQLGEAFIGIKQADVPKVIIAYEPIWAIGTGKTATPEQAQEMSAFIRGFMSGLFSEAIGECMMILYGGSVKPENARDILRQRDINGALVGGASLDPKSLYELIKISSDLKK